MTGATGSGAPPTVARARLGRNILALGAVSFLTDLSSEMIYPLLPLFLTGVLGASATAIGAIEGAAESTASLLKLASGWWSDRVRRRKPLIVGGYLMSSLVRPLVALSQSVAQVLAIRLIDRVGKGIRASPRDALIADSVAARDRGRAYGFHRAADHAGAVVGPLAAFALLGAFGVSLRTLFLLAAVPAALSVVVLLVGVREAPQVTAAPAAAADLSVSLSRRFWSFLTVLLVFTLGNATDAFVLLRAAQLGVDAPMIPILWAMLHVVKSATSTPAGSLSDRIGRRPMLIAGWLLYAAVYLGFALAGREWQAWALFAAYGVFFGLTEGAQKAMVADLVPAARRGAAFGWYNLAIGLGAFPASLIFGAIWDSRGAPAAFQYGAGLALMAALGLLVASRAGDRAEPAGAH